MLYHQCPVSYTHLNGFQIYMVMYYAGIAYLMFCSLEMARSFQNRGRELIYGLAGFLAAGTLVQILIPEIHITWLCVTLIAVLYFLYCNEMWNQLDEMCIRDSCGSLHGTDLWKNPGGGLQDRNSSVLYGYYNVREHLPTVYAGRVWTETGSGLSEKIYAVEEHSTAK